MTYRSRSIRTSNSFFKYSSINLFIFVLLITLSEVAPAAVPGQCFSCAQNPGLPYPVISDPHELKTKCDALVPVDGPLANDCHALLTAIPALNFDPNIQNHYDGLTLTLPKNAYRFHIPARLKHGSCALTITALSWDHKWYEKLDRKIDLSPSVLQMVIWSEAQIYAQHIWDECVTLRGQLGYASMWKWSVPGYKTVNFAVGFVKSDVRPWTKMYEYDV